MRFIPDRLALLALTLALAVLFWLVLDLRANTERKPEEAARKPLSANDWLKYRTPESEVEKRLRCLERRVARGQEDGIALPCR